MEELQKIISELPPHIQDLLYSDEYLAKFKAISDRFGFNVEQSGILMEEFIYVMAGLTHPDDFVSELHKELNIPKERAVEIGTAIDTEMLKPIRADLVKIYEGEKVENGKWKMENEKIENGKMERDQLLHEIENPEIIKMIGEIEETYTAKSDGAVQTESPIEEPNTPREEILQEIETPHATAPRQTLLADKLGATVRLPREEKKEDGNKQAEWRQPIDPYREPLS